MQKSFASSRVVQNMQNVIEDDADELEAISSREMESSLKPGSSKISKMNDGSAIVVSHSGQSQADHKPSIKYHKNFRDEPEDDFPLSFRESNSDMLSPGRNGSRSSKDYLHNSKLSSHPSKLSRPSKHSKNSTSFQQNNSKSSKQPPDSV